MSFTPKTWTDRNVEFPGRRKLTDSTTQTVLGTYDVTLAEGTVSGAGSEWNAANMNDLENRIATYLNTNLDVQSGTFTPAITEYDVATKYGTYLKIGNLCYITIHFKSSSDVGGSSNNITITGLPFTPFADEEQQLVVGHTASFTPSGTKMALIPSGGGTSINMWVDTGNDMMRMAHGNSGGFEIRICGVYRTA